MLLKVFIILSCIMLVVYTKEVIDDENNVDPKSFVAGGIFDHEKRMDITNECLNKPLSESPWETIVPDYCGVITCKLSETKYTTVAKFTVKECPDLHKFRPGCYDQDLNKKFPDCCPVEKETMKCMERSIG